MTLEGYLRPSAWLLLCTLLDCVTASVLPHRRLPPQAEPTATATPQQHPEGAAPSATTVPRRQLNVIPWPLPTALTGMGMDKLLHRDTNTICGYIGGDANLPATCSSGSHCVVDTDYAVVGCCPDDTTPCTVGIYTSCVDSNSGSQTALDPYAYTCTGSSVCYKNEFAGGYYQYGCGTASDMGTTVAMSVSGKSALDLSTVDASTTKGSSSSVLLSSYFASSSSATSNSSSYYSFSLKTSATATSSATTTSSTSVSSTATSSGSQNRSGIIVGATVGSVAGVIAIVAFLILCLWKRRQRNKRSGPGLRGSDGSTEKMRPTFADFQAVHSDSDGFETGLHPEMVNAIPAPPRRRSTDRSLSRPTTSRGFTERDALVAPAMGTVTVVSAAASAGKRRKSKKRAAREAAAEVPVPSPLMTDVPPPPPATDYREMSPYGEDGPEGDGLLGIYQGDMSRNRNAMVLSRIGEEDSEAENETSTRGNSVQNRSSRLSFGDEPEELQVGDVSNHNSKGSGVGSLSTGTDMTLDGDSGLEEMTVAPLRVGRRPLWQQNRGQEGGNRR